MDQQTMRRRYRIQIVLFAAVLALVVYPALTRYGPGGEGELSQLMDELCSDPPPEGDPFHVTPALCGMERGSVELVRETGSEPEVWRLPVLIADDIWERQAGYQWVGEDVILRTAILFVFPADSRGAFHMCNVEGPLDIAWFDAAGRPVDVRRMEPGGRRDPIGCEALYEPVGNAAYRYALEVPAGSFLREGEEGAALFPWRLEPPGR